MIAKQSNNKFALTTDLTVQLSLSITEHIAIKIYPVVNQQIQGICDELKKLSINYELRKDETGRKYLKASAPACQIGLFFTGLGLHKSPLPQVYRCTYLKFIRK